MDGECFGNQGGKTLMEREEVQEQIRKNVKGYMDKFFN